MNDNDIKYRWDRDSIDNKDYPFHFMKDLFKFLTIF